MVRFLGSPRGKGEVNQGCAWGPGEKVVRKLRRGSNPRKLTKPNG